MISRIDAETQVRNTLRDNPACVILGPRQCGKSTLARLVSKSPGPLTESHWFDLETAEGMAAMEMAETTLRPLRGLVVIDEIQRIPELFRLLRPLLDRPETPARFLLLGSVAPELVKGVSESLAGRVGFVDLGGFTLADVGADRMETLWLRGGFPRSFLAGRDSSSLAWRAAFIRTFLERDIPALGLRLPPATLRRFWTMTAHYHGQTWNAAELARSLSVSEGTARHYLDLLCGTYVLRRLAPWFANVGKREVKAPKVYVRDAGLLHALLGLRTRMELFSHPKFGASWEGFALGQMLAHAGEQDAWTWGTHGGAELDLLLFRGGRAYGFEFKAADAPGMTRSLHSALTDLNLEHAWILHPGTRAYPVHDKVDVLPLTHLHSLPAALREPDGSA